MLLGANGIEGAQRAEVRLDLMNVNLTVKDRSTGKPRKLLDEINMSIFPGELIGMLGPSGAGKSSFVRAGLMSRLRDAERRIAVRIRPGSKPFETLAQQLVRSSGFSLKAAPLVGH